MSQRSLQTEQGALVRIEPGRNIARAYRAAVWKDLFVGVSLVREWGRIGPPGQLRLDPYAYPVEARAALDKFVRVKRRRGYSEAA